MIKRTIEYEDFNGNKRKEDFFFHFTKADVAKMELSTSGGYTEMIKRIIAAQDNPTLVNIFEELVLKAYGQPSPDGRLFVKNDQLRTEFSQTEAYSILFMELATDSTKAYEFVNGCMPGDIDKDALEKAGEELGIPVTSLVNP